MAGHEPRALGTQLVVVEKLAHRLGVPGPHHLDHVVGRVLLSQPVEIMGGLCHGRPTGGFGIRRRCDGNHRRHRYDVLIEDQYLGVAARVRLDDKR